MLVPLISINSYTPPVRGYINLNSPETLLIEAIDEVHFETEERIRIIRTYRLNEGDNSLITRESFIMDDRDFHFYEIRRLDNIDTQRRNQTHTLEINTRTSDINEIMSALPTVFAFSYAGFVGYLDLQRDTIRTVAQNAVYERRSISDTRTYTNLPFGDISGIARNLSRNGVTLDLIDIEWTRNTAGIDYTQVAQSYNATAHFRGYYSRRVIPGFITTAEYKGEVININVRPEILYEVSFVHDIINTANNENFDVNSIEDNYIETIEIANINEIYIEDNNREVNIEPTETRYSILIFLLLGVLPFIAIAGFLLFKFRHKISRSFDDTSELTMDDMEGDDDFE